MYVHQIGWERKEFLHSKEREREMFFPTKQGPAARLKLVCIHRHCVLSTSWNSFLPAGAPHLRVCTACA